MHNLYLYVTPMMIYFISLSIVTLRASAIFFNVFIVGFSFKTSPTIFIRQIVIEWRNFSIPSKIAL